MLSVVISSSVSILYTKSLSENSEMKKVRIYKIKDLDLDPLIDTAYLHVKKENMKRGED